LLPHSYLLVSNPSGIYAAYSVDMSTPTSILKDLVKTLRDGQEGFAHASENVKNPRLKELFARFSLQRAKFAGDLEAELVNLGEKDPEKQGSSVAGAIHRTWIDLKAALTKGDVHEVLSEAERGEDVAKKAYKEALEETDLPAPVRDVISKQAVEIQAAHDEVKAFRDATAHKDS
jgi:uncharacterized protein (TIGR02284 family)